MYLPVPGKKYLDDKKFVAFKTERNSIGLLLKNINVVECKHNIYN
jgi:hypothetical protein